MSDWIELDSGPVHVNHNLTCASCRIRLWDGSLDSSPAFSGSIGVEYNGKHAMVSGPEIPIGGPLATLDVEDAAGVTLKQDVTVSQALTLGNGTLAIGSQHLSLAGTVAFKGGDWNMGPAGSIAYNQAADGQAVAAGKNYTNLILSDGMKTLAAPGIEVNGTLTLSTDVTLSGTGTTLDLGAPATVTGSGEVIGDVQRKGPFTLNQAYAFNNANTLLTFTGGTPPSQIDVTLAKSAPNNLKFSLPRTYTIAATGGSGYIATLRLLYLPAELNGLAQAGMCIWNYNPEWAALTTSAANNAAAWVETQGISSFSLFGLASKTGYQIFLPLSIH